MGGHQQPPEPKAYSTQLGGDYDSGYHADGYNVVIDPATLEQSIKDFRSKLDHQDATDLTKTLTTALLGSAAFGSIPNAGAAEGAFREFITSHAQVMGQMMDGTLADFVARVQAAAKLGYEADPVTKQNAAYARAHEYGMRYE